VLARRELGMVLDEGHEAGILYPAQRRLAQGIFSVAARPVTEFLTPLEGLPRARANMTKAEVLALAERHRLAAVPLEAVDRPGVLLGYVQVIDLRLSDGEELGPVRPLLEIRDDCTHLAALVRLQSAGEGLARVVDARGETIGVVTLERLRAPLV
jgi:putative hemolysin